MLRSHLVPLVAVIFAAAIFQVSNGALGTLLPVRLGLAAAGELATGLIATAYAGGFVVGCVIGARVIRTVGHIRAFAAFAATAAVASLLFQVAVDTTLWFALRVVHGICIAGLSTVVDSWINERTPNAARGRVIAHLHDHDHARADRQPVPDRAVRRRLGAADHGGERPVLARPDPGLADHAPRRPPSPRW